MIAPPTTAMHNSIDACGSTLWAVGRDEPNSVQRAFVLTRGPGVSRLPPCAAFPQRYTRASMTRAQRKDQAVASDGPQRPRFVAERGCYHIRTFRWQPHIAVEAGNKRCLDPSEQMRLAGNNPAPDRNPVRSGRTNQRVAQNGERMHHRLPYRIVGGNVGSGSPCQPQRECRPGRQPLDAIIVEAAEARDLVVRQARNADVTKFAVPDPARRQTVHDEAYTDPGPHGDIGEVVHADCATPRHFSKRSAVDVGVEPGRDAERRRQDAANVGSCPAGLRRRADPPIRLRLRVEFDRPERCNTERREAMRVPPSLQDRYDRRQGLVGMQGGDGGLVENFSVFIPERADALGSPKLDPGAQHPRFRTGFRLLNLQYGTHVRRITCIDHPRPMRLA
jgi:hypothetical protein